MTNVPPRILIADDEEPICTRLQEEFIAEGYVVEAANDGKQALDLSRKSQFDLAIIDIVMPEMDGVECVQQLVAINSNVLILVVSALADKATAVDAIEKGANGFLCKPFTDRQLNDALEELLSES